MITSKQIINLSDEFVSDVKGYPGTYTGVFVNPTSTDFKELFKNVKSSSVRFIADNNNKKVYVWDSDLAVHNRMADELDIYNRYYKQTDMSDIFLSGVGNLSGGKIVIRDSDIIGSYLKVLMSGNSLEKKHIKLYLIALTEINWSWLFRYIDYSKFLAMVKTHIK